MLNDVVAIIRQFVRCCEIAAKPCCLPLLASLAPGGGSTDWWRGKHQLVLIMMRPLNDNSELQLVKVGIISRRLRWYLLVTIWWWKFQNCEGVGGTSTSSCWSAPDQVLRRVRETTNWAKSQARKCLPCQKIILRDQEGGAVPDN